MKTRSIVLLALLATAPAWADYQSTILTDNPSGYWRMGTPPPPPTYTTNLGSATSVDGVVGNFVRLAQPGAIVGDANTAMRFPGQGPGSGRVTIPYSWEINPDPAAGQSYTWEAWVKSDCLSGDALALVVNRNGESGYVLYVQGDGTLWFGLNRGPSGGYWIGTNILAGDYAKLVGKWFHLACVYDYSAGVGFGSALIYTNGVLCASNAVTGAFPLVNSGGPMLLGDRNYAGMLDEVAVYDSALSASTLAAHYSAGISGAGNYQATILASNPKGYWRLGEAGPHQVQPTLAQNLGTLGAADSGQYSVGVILQQPGALVSSTNKSMYCDGSHFMYGPAGAAQNPNQAFSVEFWAKPVSLAAFSSPLASYFTGSPTSGWLFYQGNTSQATGAGWWFRVRNATGNVNAIADGAATTGWQHVVGVFTGTQVILYINGVAAATTPFTGTYLPNPQYSTSVGIRSDNGFAYTGNMDEVAVYTNALSASDVLAHYMNGTNAASGETYSGLVLAQKPISYWRLSETANPYASMPNLGYIGAAGSGVFNGVTMVTTNDTPLVGDSNPAMYFPNSGGISIPLNEALVRTNAFSYEIWYKENPGVTGLKNPMWWRDEPTGGDTRGWVHYLNESAGVRGSVYQSSSTATTWNGINSPTGFMQDQWQHLVCTWDGTLKSIYLDGALIQVNTNDARYIKLVQRAVCSIAGGSYGFNGFLDEAAYYTNALSWQRIQAHYVAARGVNPPVVGVSLELQPAAVTAYEGSTISNRVVALGTPPFTYQWYKNGTTLVAGQTGAALFLSPASQSQTGDYTLWVTNAAGAIPSDTVHVEIVAAPPTILAQPQSISRLQGATAVFTIGIGGSEPLRYQWKSNSVVIPGATSAALTLPNAQPAFAASYSVTVTNTAGATNSDTATLTVIPASPGSYAATVVSAQPQAYWRLDETNGTTAYDLVGGHDGAYDFGVGFGVPGAILGDPDPAANFPSFAGIQVPWSAALNPWVAFTVECWAKADALGAGTTRTLVSSRNREQSSNWHFGYYASANTADQWQFNTGHKTSGVRTLAGGIVDTNWHYVVCTYDDTTLQKLLYVDGQLVGSDTVPLNTFAPNVGFGAANDDPPPTDEGIGTTVFADRYSGQGLWFYGDLDEVAIYNYALTSTQVAAHYTVAGPPWLTITPAGGKVVVTWNKGVLLQAPQVTGPWTTNSAAVSPWTNTPSGARQFFRAQMP